MDDIQRIEINEEWAHTGVTVAGDFIFMSYCMNNASVI